MKLTEQQLAQLFKQSKMQGINSDVGTLFDTSDASDKRLSDVEKIADNSQLSASYQVINQLKTWSKVVTTDINSAQNKPHFSSMLLNWLKPSLATAAIVTTVYFMVPSINNSVNPIQDTRPTMFSGSFEKNRTQTLPTVVQPAIQSDIIYSGDFG